MGGAQRVRRVRTRRDRGHHQAGRRRGGQVLERVDHDVDLTAQQCGPDRGDEDAGTADGRQRCRVHVALGADGNQSGRHPRRRPPSATRSLATRPDWARASALPRVPTRRTRALTPVSPAGLDSGRARAARFDVGTGPVGGGVHGAVVGLGPRRSRSSPPGRASGPERPGPRPDSGGATRVATRSASPATNRGSVPEWVRARTAARSAQRFPRPRCPGPRPPRRGRRRTRSATTTTRAPPGRGELGDHVVDVGLQPRHRRRAGPGLVDQLPARI